MLNAGGLKVAAKRTAFGDVSNTVNISRPSKDDTAIGGKGNHHVFEKVIPSQQDRKTTSLLRPAQRPLSVSGLKSLSNDLPVTTNQLNTNLPLAEVQDVPQPSVAAANTRKVMTKKSTSIFKDAVSTQPEYHMSETHKPLSSGAPLAPVNRDFPPKNQSTQLSQSDKEEPRLTRQRSKQLAERPQEKEILNPATQTSSEEPVALRSDGIYIDEQGQVQSYDYVDPIKLAEIILVEENNTITRDVPKQSDVRDEHSKASTIQSYPEPARKSALTTVSEPEEYWDDEGEENYEEEGYVTARSFKSRGENTTGGATTVLFPKLNQKAKKELAAAKDLIEGSKTIEEIEDEAWDTTMVAEYGEEIFQYMKDLEVIDFRLPVQPR